jgi:spermidine/putrescine transport system substrate-binding protein
MCIEGCETIVSKSSRRDFIKVGVAGAVGLGLGAVAGNAIATSSFSSERAQLEAQVQELQKKIGRSYSGTVKVYNWSEYIAEGLLETFKDEYGVNVVYDTFESMDEARSKVFLGNSGYDVVVLTDYVIPDAIGGGFLSELDYDNIPNAKNVDDKFRNPPYDSGNKYTLPYMWGSTGLGWNTAEVTEGVTGWGNMFDESFLKKYSKKVTMMTEARELIGAALKYLGHSLNSVDDNELQEAKQALLKQKPYLAKYADATDYIPGLAGGQFFVSHAYNGDIYVAKEDNPDLAYTIPKEGATLWVDNMTIAQGAPNKAAGEAFINYILSPEVDALITNFRYYANPNKAATDLVLPTIKNDPGIYPPQDVLSKLEIERTFNAEEKAKWDKIYTEIVSA